MVFDVLILFILILIFIALGRRVFKFARMGFSSFVEEVVFSFGLGAGIVALLIPGIGLLGGLKKWVFYILTLSLLGVLILDVKCIIFGAVRWIRAKRAKLRPLETVLLIILGLHFLLTLFGALAPQMEWDSLAHHLTAAKAYIQNGRIFNMSPTQGWFIGESNYPSNLEMLFMLGMLLRSDVLATLIAWSVAAFLAISVYSFSRQFFSVRTSLIAMSILYCSSIVSVHATFNTVDLGVAFFALLALYAAFKWTDLGDYRFLVFSGIYAGFCAGTKYTGLPVVLVLGLLILLLSVLERKRFVPGPWYILLFGLITLAVASPWYIKNYVYTGNPVYPFFARILGGRDLPPGVAGYGFSTPWKGVDDYSTWYSLLLGYIRLPWNLTMMRSEYARAPSIGPLYLIFIPPLIFVRDIDKKIKYLLFYGLFGLTIVFGVAQQTRYMFPFIVPLAIVAAYSLYRISGGDEGTVRDQANASDPRHPEIPLSPPFKRGKLALTPEEGDREDIFLEHDRPEAKNDTALDNPLYPPLLRGNSGNSHLISGRKSLPLEKGAGGIFQRWSRSAALACVENEPSRDNLIKGTSLFILVAAMLLNMAMLLNITSIKAPVILGIESRQSYLSRVLTNHEAILYINENLPDSARIMCFDPRIYYCNVPCVYDGAVMDYGSFQDDEMRMLEELKRLNISHVLMSWDSPTFGGNTAAVNLYKKLIERGNLRGIFADDNSALYVLTIGTSMQLTSNTKTQRHEGTKTRRNSTLG